jgi:hypothetical protein
MSQQLISHSPDLKRIRDEGYDISVLSGHLVVRDVPYINSDRHVERGVLVTQLTTAGETTASPQTHVAMFAGGYPCDADGREIDRIRHSSGRNEIAPGLVVDHSFSSKPAEGRMYRDYHELVSTYVAIISSPAEAMDASATAKTFPVVVPDSDDSVFCYLDTASSRAGIVMASAKLRGRIAIIGLGGTGSYVLDQIAKTPVTEIHLFDGDSFLTHNAFRAPGAPSVEELNAKPAKVDYLATIYSRMHTGVVPHAVHLGESNLELLEGIEFAFVCIDAGAAKRVIIEKLEQLDIPFIDTGLGVQLVESSLRGTVRASVSTPSHREFLRQRVSFSDAEDDDLYSSNIQVADLNALNATLAVIKWKKLSVFYLDFMEEHSIIYTVDTNALASEDTPA